MCAWSDEGIVSCHIFKSYTLNIASRFVQNFESELGIPLVQVKKFKEPEVALEKLENNIYVSKCKLYVKVGILEKL